MHKFRIYIFIESLLLAVLLPTIGLLLPCHPPSLPALDLQTSEKLLILTTTSPQSFKEAMVMLDSRTRELLETFIRHAVGDVTKDQYSSQPQISLRSF
jgi:hypothetical protein